MSRDSNSSKEAITAISKRLEKLNRAFALEKAQNRIGQTSLLVANESDFCQLVSNISEEIRNINIEFDYLFFLRFDEDNTDNFYCTFILKDGTTSTEFEWPAIKHELRDEILSARKRRRKTHSMLLSKGSKNRLLRQVFKIASISEKQKNASFGASVLETSTALTTNVAISIGRLESKKLTKEEHTSLKSFVSSLDQANTKIQSSDNFKIIQQEVQINVSLERLRNAYMGMRRSSEFHGVLSAALKEIHTADLKFKRCAIVLFNDKNDQYEWIDELLYDKHKQGITVSNFKHSINNALMQAQKKRFIPIAIKLTKAQSTSFNKRLIKFSADGNLMSAKNKNLFVSSPFNNVVVTSSNKIGIVIGSDSKAITTIKKSQKILKKYVQTISHAYVRYQDLRKVEEQTREAQIEAALEQVRSRSLAMRTTQELEEVVAVVLEKLKDLEIENDGEATIFTYEKGTRDSICWLASNLEYDVVRFSLPSPDKNFDNRVWNKKDRGDKYVTDIITGKKVKEYFGYLFENTDFRYVPPERKAWILRQECYSRSIAFSDYSAILIPSYSGLLLNPEQGQVLVRFSNVFGQAYTRFLDLQKAEAQTREAQIETALERVRSGTMAMNKSEDIKKVILIIFQQLQELGLQVDEANFNFNQESGDANLYMVNNNGVFPEIIRIPFINHPGFAGPMQAFKKGRLLYSDIQNKKEKDILYRHVFKNSNLPNAYKKHLRGLKGIARSMVIHKSVILNIINHDSQPFTDEENNILKRFGTVFQQSYTRFRDIEMAEERAQEAKLDVSLERVRSSAMYMQKSEDFPKVLNVLFAQMQSNWFGDYWISFCHIDVENQVTETWNRGIIGFDLPERIDIPFIDHSFSKSIVEDRRRDVKISHKVLSGNKKKTWTNYLLSLKEVQTMAASDQSYLQSLDKIYVSLAYLKYGHLTLNGPEQLTTDKIPILEQFVKALSFAYTRMIDLQKTEEQARNLKLVFKENERLLHSILPMTVADQLKKGNQTVVQRFDNVSILFADLVGFTLLSEKLNPQEVVDLLNSLFSKFDDLTDMYGIEKIKTIGDAYMVAAGVPKRVNRHAKVLFSFAQDMLKTLKTFNKANKRKLELRIGLSSGPVVAGVIGKKKFTYDLWGDTVNTAARMEAYGHADRIQISPSTYKYLKKLYKFEKIPNVEIKGKGRMDVYLWSG